MSNAAAKRVDDGITETIKTSWSVPRATARRTESLSPAVSANGLRESSRRTRRIRLKIYIQISWKKRCRRAGVHHAALSGTLGVQLARLCVRPLSVDENRRKNGQFSKIELKLCKTMLRLRFGPKSEQLTFADEQRCGCPF